MIEMAEEPIQNLRETSRNLLKLNRQVHKDEIKDVRRSIENIRITSSVAEIANKLKNKSTISLPYLRMLKNSLIEDTKNIEIVLSTHGALRGLVREVSGTDVKRQCAAAGCCCNLALGDSKACLTVARAAGPYLVAALDNLSEELAVTCAWTLGNIAGSGRRAAGSLCAQGAPGRLAARLHAGGGAAAAAEYALTHIAYHMEDTFSSDHVNKIIEAYTERELTVSSSQLLFVLSCHHELLASVPVVMLHRILDAVTVSTKKHLNICKGTDPCCELVYLMRMLANLTVKKEYSVIVLQKFISEGMCVDFHRILSADNVVVRDSLLWLLGNVYNSSNDNCSCESFFYELAYCSKNN